MLRSLGEGKKQVISFTEKDSLAWYPNPRADSIIVVEDQLSAVRASQYMTAVALLGTHMNEPMVLEIRERHQPVYLALDADAVAKAVKYVVKYRSLLPMQLLTLDKDIKDMTHEEADALFARIGASRLLA